MEDKGPRALDDDDAVLLDDDKKERMVEKQTSVCESIFSIDLT
jgi:hypothetical protein